MSYGEVHARALGILHHLQAMGAQRGDKMIIFLMQQRAIPRRVLGRGRGRHRAGAARRRHQRRASAQAVAGGAQARTPVPLHRREEPGAPAGARGRGRGNRALRRTQVALFPGGIDHRHLAAGQAPPARPLGSRLHPVLLRLDQRAEGRDADARQSDRQHRGRDRRRQIQRSRRHLELDAADPRHGIDRLLSGAYSPIAPTSI